MLEQFDFVQIRFKFSNIFEIFCRKILPKIVVDFAFLIILIYHYFS